MCAGLGHRSGPSEPKTIPKPPVRDIQKCWPRRPLIPRDAAEIRRQTFRIAQKFYVTHLFYGQISQFHNFFLGSRFWLAPVSSSRAPVELQSGTSRPPPDNPGPHTPTGTPTPTKTYAFSSYDDFERPQHFFIGDSSVRVLLRALSSRPVAELQSEV